MQRIGVIGGGLRRRLAAAAYSTSRPRLGRILATDKIDPICEQVFLDRGHSFEQRLGLSPDEISKILPDYDGLVVRSGTQVTADLLDMGSAGNLKIVGRAGTGVDNIDVAAASKTGVLVVNTPSGNTISTAELALSHMLCLARNIPQATASLKAGAWDRKKYTGTELVGKTLGIMGLGRIGQEVARWTQALGMKVVGYDPIVASSAALEMGIEPVNLNELFEKSDFITIHTPLTNETRNLFNSETLARCKAGVRIINCARGGIVNEAALLESLNAGHVGGAALDVYSVEPPSAELIELINHPSVVCTPHLGASTKDAQVRVAKDIAAQMADIIDQKGFTGVVNAPDISFAKTSRLMPYMFLAEQIARLHGQLLGDNKIARIRVTLLGKNIATSEMAESIRTATLKGVLSSILTTPVNYINASSLGNELGLKVSTVLADRPDNNYDSSVRLEFLNEGNLNSARTITGTVFKGSELRIVDVDGYAVDFHPKGNCLFFNNEDRPGVVKNVAELLGKHGINIGDFTLGRKLAGDVALGIVATDQPVTNELVAQLETLPEVFNVAAVTFPETKLDQVTQSSVHPLYSPSMPSVRPFNSQFSSGPCKKRPGYRLDKLPKESLGRSHRSGLGKARLKKAIVDSKRILGVPDDYLLGIVPASDTGAYEMAMWNMLGERPVDMCHWESFGKGWFGDATAHLGLKEGPGVREFTAEYGELPDLHQTSPDHDICFTWNGTTSGVRVPNADWISPERTGLTLNDATSAAFAMDMQWDKLDVTTYSWQKVLGGEGAHGVMILSPRAVERLESFTPANRPLPKIFRMTKKGKVDRSIFEGSTINTPSMLAVEDYLDALHWAESIGGLPELIKRSKENLSVVERFVEHNDWIHFLAKDPAQRSSTSICLTLDLDKGQVKEFVSLLEAQDVALDIGSYRDAPAGLRIWGGATVEKEDLENLMPWLTWAYNEVSASKERIAA